MARQGLLPKHLATCRIPACTACLYGRATKRPWRTKPNKRFISTDSLKHKGAVSVDMLHSPIPGLVAQMTGNLTTKRYNFATVYIHVTTGYSYIQLQESSSAKETLAGKQAFENHCKEHKITVTHYHADNGTFRAHAWREDCTAKGQRLTFAGANAHFQNGIAEQRIRILQELTRTTLLHAAQKWP